MKKIMFVNLIIIFILSACSNVETQVIPTKTAGPSPTKTLISSHTPRPATKLPPISTFTPTLDASTIVTVTPAQRAECPESKEGLSINLPDEKEYVPEDFLEYTNPILEYLNIGGSPTELLLKLKVKYGENEYEIGELRDVTNDSINEVIIKYPGYIVFSCEEKQYKIIFEDGLLANHEISNDVNLNGIPEIIRTFGWCSGSGCVNVNILEWAGGEFQSIGNGNIDGPIEKGYKFQDINGDGIKEFVMKGDAPGICCMDINTPWRYKSIIYSWSGVEYLESYIFFDKADYRFQSIQDGDRETLYRNYEIALKHYQDTIFDSSLDWWTEERKDYEVKLFYDSYNPITPTPLPYPLENPSEYQSLASYAYYRIMLIQLVQGQTEEANQTYQTLQNIFGNNPYAKPYIEMTKAFLEAYQVNQRMYDGCAAAIQYAVEHPEILIPLGSDYHGSQAKIYKPGDICPFR